MSLFFQVKRNSLVGTLISTLTGTLLDAPSILSISIFGNCCTPIMPFSGSIFK